MSIILAKIAFTIRNAQIFEKYSYTIISCSRRGIIRTANIFSQNYKYSGHSLDTIMAQFFPSQKEISAPFIVSILYTGGHYVANSTVNFVVFYLVLDFFVDYPYT